MRFKLILLTAIFWGAFKCSSSSLETDIARERGLHLDPEIDPDYSPINPKADNGDIFEVEENPDEQQNEDEKQYNEKDIEELTEEEHLKQMQNEGLPEDMERIEFIEDVSKDFYLMYLDWEDRYYLDLFMFDKNLKNMAIEEDGGLDYFCPKMLFNAMDLTGYFSPILKPPIIDECPHLELSCCTVDDFHEIEVIWEEQIKPSTEENHFYLDYYVRSVLEHREIYSYTASRLLEISSDDTCRKISQTFLNLKITDEDAQKTISLMEEAKKFDIKVKQSIPCLVCNHKNIA